MRWCGREEGPPRPLLAVLVVVLALADVVGDEVLGR
jgi:hypothetical protein